MNRTITTLFILLVSLTSFSQELEIKSFTVATNDITASTQLRNDANGDACALVKVLFATPGATFAGNIVGNVAYNVNQYFVYMTSGSKQLVINHPNFLPLDVKFSDYGITSIKGKQTYLLTLSLPSSAKEQEDAGGNFAILAVNPQTAIVMIDRKPLKIDPSGQYTPMLSYGIHEYEVTCTGYLPKSGTFTIGKGKSTELNVKLESALATLAVNCPTKGVTLYVDKKPVGASPWTGEMQEGMHLIEAKLDGYRSVQKSITLAEQQKLSVSLDALTPIHGNLSVSYRPVGADIYIDGKKSGTTPAVVNALLVGSHQVEIKKDGYTPEAKTITITEGQTAALEGSLKAVAAAGSSPASVLPVSNSTGSNTTSFNVNGVTFEMIKVEGGTFMMGATPEMEAKFSDDEKPVHQVTLTNNYYLGKTEVTQALWKAVMGEKHMLSASQDDNKPVSAVTISDYMNFLSKLNSITGRNFRLPTEAEWEFAARGGNKSQHFRYSGSNNLDDVAWYDGNTEFLEKPHDVATKQPNEIGLYDMSGNVREWCSDFGDDMIYRYSSKAQKNPTGGKPKKYGWLRMTRGGAIHCSADACRSSSRYRGADTYQENQGLRLALSE